MSSSKRKSEFLGIPHGTASSRLRKMIMFDLVCRLGENVCFSCNKPIESVDDFSIEHKDAWENVSVDLFWDLNNISFSHIRCNVPSRRVGGIGRRKIGKDGEAWCCTCQEFLPINQFWKNKRNWNGLQCDCKSCMTGG